MYEQLKEEYIASKTKGWDKETFDNHVCDIEEDFHQWYSGYEYAMKTFKTDALPVLEFTLMELKKIDSSAGLFGQALKNLIHKIKSI